MSFWDLHCSRHAEGETLPEREQGLQQQDELKSRPAASCQSRMCYEALVRLRLDQVAKLQAA